MKRPLVLAAALLALWAAPAGAATKTYSTGDISAAIPDGGVLERALAVPDKGPVAFVRVRFRIGHPRGSDLTISLVSPAGTVVPLVVRRGAGADFGAERKGCGGTLTVLDADWRGNPIDEGASPFTDNPYSPEGSLKRLDGEEAKGRWTLRIEDGAAGSAGTLYCFQLDITRNVVEAMTAAKGQVWATVSFVEREYLFSKVRLKVVRRGKTVVDSPVGKLRCRDCGTFRPTKLDIRDLDGGEPEVILEMYSGGAHCCVFTLILGYDAQHARYRTTPGYWGNYAYRLVDLDRDGLPEFSAYDERFVYTFTAYVFSAAPIQIWKYRQGKLVEVTRDFPALIEKDAASLLKTYEKARKEKDVDLRAFVAARVADLYLLGRGDEAQRFLQTALERGDLGQEPDDLGTPAGQAYVKALLRYLREWGYITS